MLPDDDTLPFDELDPCCQKEILHKRKEKEIKSQLRHVDRSNQRYDAANSVFSKVSIGWKCFCCQESKDYFALAQLKESLVEKGGHNEENKIDSRRSEVDSDEEEDDDDDYLLNDLDIPLTVSEMERIQGLQKRLADAETAKQYGLSIHSDDSLEHIQQFVQQSEHIPVVLHIYQPDKLGSAQIDYLLENKLSGQYLGTRFRRIALTTLSMLPSIDNAQYPWISEPLLSYGQSIVCFMSGRVVNTFHTFEEWGEHLDDLQRHLQRHLTQTHVLHEDLPAINLLHMLSNDSQRGQEQQDEEEERFCEDLDCMKRYPHEHVGRRNNNLTSSTASFAKARQAGSEALAPNTFLRL